MPPSKGSPILSWQIQSWLSLKLRIIFRCSDRATCAFRWLSSDLMSSPNNGGVEPFWTTPSVPAVVTFITLYPHVFAPPRISPVEIMKPDLSSRRVSAGFTIITVEQKEPTPLCSTKRRNQKKKRMKLCGRDKETIPAVSTMSCLWKLIKFSVMAGDG